MSSTGLLRGSRRHAGFTAAVVHRVSGIALAVFLPLHFLTLSLSLNEELFAGAIAWTDNGPMKAVEALLVTALAVHFAGGARLLAIEFLGLTRGQAFWIATAFAAGLGGGLAFALAAFG